MSSMEELRKAYEAILDGTGFLRTGDIPNIDLYMDQVLTFLNEKLAGSARSPENGTFLTKTMINNYVKSGLLPPPVKKKYTKEHLILLLFIFYMKSFLAQEDIAAVLKPLAQAYTGRTEKEQEGPDLQEIYDRIADDLEDQIREVKAQSGALFDAAGAAFYQDGDSPFAGLSVQERSDLQKLDLICRLSVDIYVRKLFIERLLDQEKEDAGPGRGGRNG